MTTLLLIQKFLLHKSKNSWKMLRICFFIIKYQKNQKLKTNVLQNYRIMYF